MSKFYECDKIAVESVLVADPSLEISLEGLSIKEIRTKAFNIIKSIVDAIAKFITEARKKLSEIAEVISNKIGNLQVSLPKLTVDVYTSGKNEKKFLNALKDLRSVTVDFGFFINQILRDPNGDVISRLVIDTKEVYNALKEIRDAGTVKDININISKKLNSVKEELRDLEELEKTLEKSKKMVDEIQDLSSKNCGELIQYFNLQGSTIRLYIEMLNHDLNAYSRLAK